MAAVHLTEAQQGCSPAERPGGGSLSHGDHRLYRCNSCAKPMTFETTKTGCEWCGAKVYRAAFAAEDWEIEWAKERGFDPAPDQWEHKPDAG